MAVHSFHCRRAAVHLFLACFIFAQNALAITGSVYQLDSEYSGANFFQGWDFFTGGDPTGGFVTYYSQSSAQLQGLVNSSDTSPVYIGSDYNTVIGSTSAAGRPSVRISTKRSWTHGLFIGDFNHAPGGVCGTWPAFWTLAPNWPNNGEIDIMEGVNQNLYNAATLHSSTVCTIAGDKRTMTGTLTHNDCAYYPGYNVGCGVLDNRTTSFGNGFNAIGGGIYAMQWTSDYIRVWFFPRNAIPSDIINKAPNPSSWGPPSANLQGSCVIDQHFQGHKLIMNNAFCGEYAGAASVWNSTTNSCATSTGYSTCNAYVAGVPGAFQNAYWSINSVRVYQLLDSSNATNTSVPYIASNQPTASTASATASSATPSPTTSLCPTYNFTVVQSGNFNYEVECGVNIGGSDLGKPYSAYTYSNFEGCVAGCNYWNTFNATNICGGVTYQVSSNACYWKRSVGSSPAAAGYNSARLIYYAYPQVTDDPRSQITSSTTSYVSTSVTPAYYAPANVTTTTSFSLITETPTANITDGGGGALGGGATTDDSSSTTDAGSSTSGSRSFTQSRNRTSTTDTTITSSTSVLLFTSGTATLTTSSSVPPASMTAGTTALPPTSMASTVPLSPQSSMPSSLSVPASSPSSPSSTVPVDTSRPASTSNLALSSQVVVTPSASTAPSSVQVIASSAVSPVQIPTSLSSRTSSGYVFSSIISTPTSSSIPATLSSQALSSSPLLSSSALVSPLMPQSSTANTGPATSASITLQPPPPASSTSVVAEVVVSQIPSSSPQSLQPSSGPLDFSSTTTPAPGSASDSMSMSQPPPISTTAETSISGPVTITTSDNLPGPTKVVSENGDIFALAGCLGPRRNTQFANSFTLVEDSPLMSVERCVRDCSLDVYAGLYDTQCYCSSYSRPTDSSEDFIEYPVSACNTTCPGDATQKCGGKVSVPSRLVKRQIMDTNGDLILLTLYNNTAGDIDVGAPSTSTTPTTSGAAIGGPGVASSTVSMSMSDTFSTPSPPLVTTSSPLISSLPSGGGSQTDNPILNSASTTSTSSSPTTPNSDAAILQSTSSFPPSQTLSPTTISTTYTTICPFHPIVCPSRTETCLTTIVTVLHCGCTDTPVPDVPMTTTVVEGCAITTPPNANANGQVGDGNEDEGVPTTTLTVPCTESISSLEAAVTAWSAIAYATAAASAAAGNTHIPIPYTFPLSFPMTSSSAAGAITKNLVIATAPFNFSVPAVPTGRNGTWYGEVMNVTVVPVSVGPGVSAGASVNVGASAAAGGMRKSGAVSTTLSRRGVCGVGGVVMSLLSLSLWLLVL